jgi:hypothetical protein
MNLPTIRRCIFHIMTGPLSKPSEKQWKGKLNRSCQLYKYQFILVSKLRLLNLFRTYVNYGYGGVFRQCCQRFRYEQKIKYCNGFGQIIARQRLSKHVRTRNNGNCVSVDECYCSLLGSSQRVNELAGQQSRDLCFLRGPCEVYITRTCCSLD